MSAVSSQGAPAFPFIVARGRSGTTLLRAMLDAHPSMCLPGESHFVVQFAKRRARYETTDGFEVGRFTRDLLEHWAFRRWSLSDSAVLEALEATPPTNLSGAIRSVYASYASVQGKPRYADKTPSYVLHVGSLAEMFPEAVFIHLIRDGRDVALSYLATDFGVSTLGQAAIHWDRFVRAGRSAGALLGPTRYREVRYEELVREPVRVLGEICTFVGLPFDDRMLRYFEKAGAFVPGLSHSEHHQNLYQPPTVGLRDWRRQLSTSDVAVFESLAGDLLDELGYERQTDRPGLGAAITAARFRAGTGVRGVAHGAHVRTRRLRRRITRRIAGRDPRPGATAYQPGAQP